MLLERLLLLLVGIAIGFFVSLPFTPEPTVSSDPCAELGLEVARLRRRVAELEARLNSPPEGRLPQQPSESLPEGTADLADPARDPRRDPRRR